MTGLERCSCPNSRCRDHGLRLQGNISVRGRYGKNRDRILLYCRTCGKRFAASRAGAMFGVRVPTEMVGQVIMHISQGAGIRSTARMTGLDKDTVSRIAVRAGDHCSRVFSELLASLDMDESQLDTLCAFIRRRKLPAAQPQRET